MSKVLAAGIAALFVTAAPIAHAQTSSIQSMERLSTADGAALTDARIAIIKSTLQLTPDQEKLWPPIEAAIRDRTKDRVSRLTAVERTVGERRENPIEAIRDRNPIDFINRRADRLEQRGADLKKLAGAWQPLYQTLSTEQKRRMGYLAVVVLRELKDGVEQRRLMSADQDD